MPCGDNPNYKVDLSELGKLLGQDPVKMFKEGKLVVGNAQPANTDDVGNLHAKLDDLDKRLDKLEMMLSKIMVHFKIKYPGILLMPSEDDD